MADYSDLVYWDELQSQADQLVGKLGTLPDPEQAVVDFVAYFLSSVEAGIDDEAATGELVWRVATRILNRLEHGSW